jgi:micrococcal nuclease
MVAYQDRYKPCRTLYAWNSLLLVVVTTLLVFTGESVEAAHRVRQFARVIRVVDGDTFIAYVRGTRESIRLIGIDAPESGDNTRVKKQSEKLGLRARDVLKLGTTSKRFLKTMLKRFSGVQLEFDVRPRDRYRRLLCYVYLKDGRMVNEVVVRSGFAWASSYPPNVKHQHLFQAAQHEAEAKRSGLWRE